jgi:hypothetical protein
MHDHDDAECRDDDDDTDLNSEARITSGGHEKRSPLTGYKSFDHPCEGEQDESAYNVRKGGARVGSP